MPRIPVPAIRLSRERPFSRRQMADNKETTYAAAWLAWPESDIMTGHVIAPNGGMTIVAI